MTAYWFFIDNFRICNRSQSYDSFQMVPSSPSCGSDSGLTSDQDTLAGSSPAYNFKVEDFGLPKSEETIKGLTTAKSFDYESLDAIDVLFEASENSENHSVVANNQVKIEPGELPLMDQNQDILMEDINQILYGGNGYAASDPLTASTVTSGVTAFDHHDDSSTDLFPDLGDVIDPNFISTY